MAMARRWLIVSFFGCAVAWAPGMPPSRPPPQKVIETSAPEPAPSSVLEDERPDQPSVGTFLLGAALGFLVAIGTSAPAFAKYKDKVDKNKLLGSSWTYDDFPAWRNTSPICVAGASQSPVDLVNEQLFERSKEKLGSIAAYVPVEAEVFNANSMTLNVQGNFGTLQLPDGEYSAKQFHFHFPSEHEINGKRHDGEMHIVHFRTNAGNYTGVSIAVVAVFLDIVPENPFLSLPFAKAFQSLVKPAMASPLEMAQDEVSLLKAIGLEATIPASGKTVTLDRNIDLNAFRSELDGKFYHYRGSLTTPPCTENVHWYVAEKSAPVTRQMIQSWEKAFPKSTARPVQKLNKRKVVASELSVPGEFPPGTPKVSA